MNTQILKSLTGVGTQLVEVDAKGQLARSTTSFLTNALNSGLIRVGNGSNIATPISISGDATINNAGVLTLGTVPITKGGTGATTRAGAITNLFPIRIATVAGNVAITNADYTVGIRKIVPAVTQVDLPAGYAGARFEISDFADNADSFPITIVPNGVETIMGESDMVMNVKGGSITIVFNINNLDRRII